MRPVRKFSLWIILPITIVLTVLSTLLFLNITSGQAHIHHQLDHQFAAAIVG